VKSLFPADFQTPEDLRMTLRQLITVKQLAEAWQVSKRTVYRMIDNGELPAKKFGRAVRIDPEVITQAGRSASAELPKRTKK
jgi:excisionase family DNA binding protein